MSDIVHLIRDLLQAIANDIPGLCLLLDSLINP